MVGRSEATARSRASPPGAKEPACGGALAQAGGVGRWRRAGGKLERRPQAASRRGALSRRALGGRVRGLGGRRRQGAARGPRGVSELGSRGTQTPPHCESRLRGGGRPGPPSASHRRRRRLPGLPGPRNAVAVAGGAVSGEGEGAIAAGPVSPPQLSFPDGAPCWGIWWQARAVGSLNPSLPRPVAWAPPQEEACFSSPDTGFGFPVLVSLLPTCADQDKSLNLSGTVSASVKWGCW